MGATGDETRRDTVGFIGLGRMGRPMATNLIRAGYELIVRDADRDVEQRFTDLTGAASAREASAFATASAVITMLPDGRVVQDGAGGWNRGRAFARRGGRRHELLEPA